LTVDLGCGPKDAIAGVTRTMSEVAANARQVPAIGLAESLEEVRFPREPVPERSRAAGELAAVSETYATAWTCLFRNLEFARGQKPVMRGAASSFGQAALNTLRGAP